MKIDTQAFSISTARTTEDILCSFLPHPVFEMALVMKGLLFFLKGDERALASLTTKGFLFGFI